MVLAQQVSEHKGTSDVRPLFREARQIAGKKPMTMTSDGAANFAEACKNEYYTNTKPRTVHIKDITLTGKIHNQKMERMNGEVRDREKVVRGVKSEESPLLKGSQIFHNFVRPHDGLNGITPAEAAGIKVEGGNKWMTFIQNASKMNE